MNSRTFFFIFALMSIILLSIPADASLSAPTSYGKGYKIWGNYWDGMGDPAIQNGTGNIADYAFLVYRSPWNDSIMAINGTTGSIAYNGTWVSVVNSAANTLPRGGVVRVKSDVYSVNFSSAVTVPAGVTLDLTGANITVTNITAVTIQVNSGGVLKGGYIDAMNLSAKIGNSWHYLRANGGTIENINLTNASVGMCVRIQANGSVVRNIGCYSNQGNPDPAIWNTGTTGEMANIEGNHIVGGWYDGIYTSSKGKVIKNEIHNITHAGIYAAKQDYGHSTIISDNIVYENHENGIDGNSSGLIITNNRVYRNGRSGIAISGQNNIISNNIVFNNNQTGQIGTGNTFVMGAGIDIVAYEGYNHTSNNTVLNNIVYDDQIQLADNLRQQYGIRERVFNGLGHYPNNNTISNNIVLYGGVTVRGNRTSVSQTMGLSPYFWGGCSDVSKITPFGIGDTCRNTTTGYTNTYGFGSAWRYENGTLV